MLALVAPPARRDPHARHRVRAGMVGVALVLVVGGLAATIAATQPVQHHVVATAPGDTSTTLAPTTTSTGPTTTTTIHT